MDILDLDQEVEETLQDNPLEGDITEEEGNVAEEVFANDQLPDGSEPVQEEAGKKTVLSDKMLLAGIILGAVVIVIAGMKLISMTMDYRKGNKVYDTVREVVIKDEAAKGIPKPDKDKTEEPEVERPWYQSLVVDMDELKQINSDAVGWIHFENEDISYPIVQGKDNDTYIHTAFTGEEVSAGSIFMDFNNDSDFSDAHTLIYGHNMKNLSMFGRLKYYNATADYYTDHQYFQVITEDGYYRYRIIGYKEVPGDDDIYAIYKSGTENFVSFAKNTVLKGSRVNAGYEVTGADKIITLSTCTTGDNRFVVSAARVEEYHP